MGKNQKTQSRPGRRGTSSSGAGRSKTSSLGKSPITREFSSGGVVFKKEKEKVLWLIRKTAPSKLFPKQYWMFPKGRIDDRDGDNPGPMASGEVRADQVSLRSAALREVGEEAGVKATIVEKIGTATYSYLDPSRGKILKFVTFFLMEWVENLPGGHDQETAEISWLPFEGAYKTLSFSREKQTLKKAKEILDSGI